MKKLKTKDGRSCYKFTIEERKRIIDAIFPKGPSWAHVVSDNDVSKAEGYYPIQKAVSDFLKGLESLCNQYIARTRLTDWERRDGEKKIIAGLRKAQDILDDLLYQKKQPTRGIDFKGFIPFLKQAEEEPRKSALVLKLAFDAYSDLERIIAIIEQKEAPKPGRRPRQDRGTRFCVVLGQMLYGILRIKPTTYEDGALAVLCETLFEILIPQSDVKPLSSRLLREAVNQFKVNSIS